MAVLKREKPDLQKKVHEVPHKPGVYLMRDRFNRVIYVGKARDLRKRVSSYFLPSKLAQADLKTRAMLDATWDFETHTVRSEAESVLLEGKLIKEYRPRYNVSFRDDKRFLVVRVDLSEEWPRFRLARFKKDDGNRYFGPYAHAGALRQTLNFMRKKFGVLTFGRGAPTERELKSSTYQVPVRLSEISAAEYRERVAQACEFLEGKSREMIAALERVQADKLVAPSSSCAITMAQDYERILADEPEWAERARRLGERIVSFTRFAYDLAIERGATGRPLAIRATYHDACQSANVLNLRDEPRELLRRVAGVQLTEMADSAVCCGFGGTFSFEQVTGTLSPQAPAGSAPPKELRIGARNVTVSLGGGVVSLRDGTGLLLVTADGLAGRIGGTLSLSVPGAPFAFTGTFSVAFNTGTTAVTLPCRLRMARAICTAARTRPRASPPGPAAARPGKNEKNP